MCWSCSLVARVSSDVLFVVGNRIVEMVLFVVMSVENLVNRNEF